jgi:serine protease inhibitor
MKERNVQIWLPRFSMQMSTKLKDVLVDQGLKTIFDKDSADLSGINGVVAGEGRLYVDNVIHEGRVKIYEDGTKAATVASAFQMPNLVSVDNSPKYPFQFHAKRTFIFLIVHKPTKSVLYMGRVGNLESKI